VLARPIDPGEYRPQVIYAEDDLERIRKLPAVKQWINGGELDKATLPPELRGSLIGRLAEARSWLGIEPIRVPRTQGRWLGGTTCPYHPEVKLQSAQRIPEIACTRCDYSEIDTPAAGRAWLDDWARGGLDSLGLAYTLTQDERYARKAIEIALMYAKQYRDLPWNHAVYDAPWHHGSASLVSSRIARASSYGTNILHKPLMRMLCAVADSPSWTPEARRMVYEGWLVPLASELRLRPGMSNMTDLSNYDLILAGLFSADAAMLWEGIYSQTGLAYRVSDIQPDGFSSEGRPLNYHFAGMVEYVPIVTFLRRSGLAGLELDLSRLLSAARMPLGRAAGDGLVPLSGDNGGGMRVGPHKVYGFLYEVFPREHWLLELSRGTTLRSALSRLERDDRQRQDWKQLIETGPKLYPDAGYAILRSGRGDDQVFASLDYGPPSFHGANDRMMVALWAYGRIFCQGPGSGYNCGSQYKGGDPKARAFLGHGSLGHNVVLVDCQDQARAAGRRILWRTNDDYQAVAAKVTGLHPAVEHDRALVLIDRLVVVLDRIVYAPTEQSAIDTHTVDWLWHAFGSLSMPADQETTAPDGPLGAVNNYQNLRNVRRIQGGDVTRLTWTYPEGGPALDLWQPAPKDAQRFLAVSGGLNAYHLIRGEDKPCLIVRTATADREKCELRVATVFEPRRSAQEPPRIAAVTQQGRPGAIGATVALRDGAKLSMVFSPEKERAAVLEVERKAP
jgi:hypothetical protein